MVRFFRNVSYLSPLFTSAIFAFPPPSQGYGGHHERSVGKAIYLLANDAVNAVVALPIKSDGTLSKGRKVPTGGHGSNIATKGDKSTPQTPDSLGSQGAVAVAGEYVFAVNAGSNTISMLRASGHDASDLILVGKPAQLPGDFPTTIGVSQKHRLACVGLTGARAGVSCVPYTDRGLGRAGTLHPFDLGQSTPPNSSLDLVSRTFFSDDESHVYTTVRGATGFFSSIPVDSHGGQPSKQGVQSLKDFSGVLFGAVVVPGTEKIFVADPKVGADVLTVNPHTEEASLEKAAVVSGQKATCWIALSTTTNSAYLSDAAVDRVVELSLTDGSVTKVMNLGNGDPGMFDLAVGGNYIYALYAGNGTIPASVTVLTTEGKQGILKQVQHFELTALDVTPNASGIDVMM